MRRLFWLAMGVTIGALVVRKLSKAAARLTPTGMAQGLSASLGDLADALRDFAADVRAGMADREEQLRSATGLEGQVGRVPRRSPGVGQAE
jgi:chromosome condensin MukBEF MukE localization factor